MKKILTLAMVLVLSTSASFAFSFGKSIKKAFKSDVKAAKTAVKNDVKSTKKAIKSDIKAAKTEAKNTRKSFRNAVKQDIENSTKAQTEAATAKKTEKLNQINSKLTQLNKELTNVKSSKEITETERTLRTRALQRQIEFYNKQKAALQ